MGICTFGGAQTGAAQGDRRPVAHVEPVGLQPLDVAEIDQKAAVTAQKKLLGQPLGHGGEGLPGQEGALRAVEQAAVALALCPDQAEDGELQTAAAAEELQPVEGVPPEVPASEENGGELVHGEGLSQKAHRVKRVAGDGRLTAGDAENQSASA